MSGAPTLVPAPAEVAAELAWLLLGAALIGMAARWARVPYAVALVLGGLMVAEINPVAVPHLAPDLVLFLFLPPLLFDAAFRLDAARLRDLWRTVLWLAVPGTLLSALVVQAVLVLVLGVPPAPALLFGSLVAATDPVAVVAVFARLGVRFRLAVIAESESLVNDGVAITLYTVGLRILAGGEFEPLRTAGVFAWEVAVGLAVGIAFGLAVSRLTALVDDHLIEMTLSSALAYGSYIAAESLGASGALACVAAGAVHGTYGRRVGMSVTTRGRLDDLWEYLGFAANGVLFLLVGFSANLAAVAARAGPLAVVVAAIVGARLVIVELSTRVVPPARRSLAPGERLVLVWGGLRGALTVALALALPVELAERPLLVELAFGVVLFTLLGQGLTLSPLIRWLGVAAPSGGRGEPV